MNRFFNILSSCNISNDIVEKNDNTLVSHSENSENWLVDIYHAMDMNYPKFFKMDNLCKAGILAAECLLNGIEFDRENVKDDWAIVLANSASSLDDDRHYQTTIQNDKDYYPSPAIFVYTLANIITGEIAIRHKIGGESSFYVFPTFSSEKIDEIIEQTFSANPELTHIIFGWTDYDNGNCDIRLWLAKRS